MMWMVVSAQLILPPFCSAMQDNGLPDESNTEEVTGDHQQAEDESHTNHLASETSLYLLSHAENPVDWYPWGEEAIKKAKDENKPIFLSVGYSSCHWCHVMEDESFKDEEIARLLNESFVCIKVDREERPDVDQIYMEGLYAYHQYFRFTDRSGGWPLTVFMTPDLKPFFGATYLPAHDSDQGKRAGFLSVVRNISRIWDEDRKQILDDAEAITELAIRRLQRKHSPGEIELERAWIDQSVASLNRSFDQIHGGFGFRPNSSKTPKFPQPSRLLFLLDQVQRRDDGQLKTNADTILKVSLDKMMLGGIYDHVGGGFHRYSVDRFWHIPHFEKMLYDNAQLTSLYALAAEHYDDPNYRQVAIATADFVLNQLTDQQGGFYSSIDADSENSSGEKEEGAFYVWSRDELKQILTEDEFQLVGQVYGLNGDPNFEEKYYHLFLTVPLSELADQMGTTGQELEKKLRPIHEKLKNARTERPQPLIDDKILAAWNGLMIRGLADVGRVVEQEKYLDAAARSADFIWDNMRNEQGELYRTFTKGKPYLNAYAEDYAFVIDGLLALYKATTDQKWLDRAKQLQTKQDELYWDESGGYFFTSDNHEKLLIRARTTIDRAIPASNSVSARNLLELAKLTSDPELEERAEATAKSVHFLMISTPFASPRMLMVIDRLTQDEAKVSE